MLRIQGVAPGMLTIDTCAKVWYLRGLHAVNPPPRPDDDPLSVLLLFNTEENARATMRGAEMVPVLPGSESASRRCASRPSGTPEEAHWSHGRRWTSDGGPTPDPDTSLGTAGG